MFVRFTSWRCSPRAALAAMASLWTVTRSTIRSGWSQAKHGTGNFHRFAVVRLPHRHRRGQ